MIYNREKYLNKLINKCWNGRIKVITGLRRCGKSTILFELFRNYLLESGVKKENNLIFSAPKISANSSVRLNFSV